METLWKLQLPDASIFADAPRRGWEDERIGRRRVVIGIQSVQSMFSGIEEFLIIGWIERWVGYLDFEDGFFVIDR